MAVFRTPKDKLFEEPELDEYVPEQVEARRKNNEEEWADAIRAEIAAKKGLAVPEDKAKGNMSKRDAAMLAARERQFIVEGVIRKRVGEMELHSVGILRAVLAVATSGVNCLPYLSQLFPLAASLVGSPLVGALAENAASVLAKFSPDAHRGGYRLSLPLALARLRSRNAATQENAAWSAASILAIVLRSGSALDAGPFAIVFPLIQAVIDAPNTASLLEAVSILELQAVRGDLGYPRGAMVSALLNAIVVKRCSCASLFQGGCGLGQSFWCE